MKKPTYEQVKNILLIIAIICLFKIAFFGITTNLKTEKRGLNINTDVSHITVDGTVSVDGTGDAFSKPISIIIED